MNFAVGSDQTEIVTHEKSSLDIFLYYPKDLPLYDILKTINPLPYFDDSEVAQVLVRTMPRAEISTKTADKKLSKP